MYLKDICDQNKPKRLEEEEVISDDENLSACTFRVREWYAFYGWKSLPLIVLMRMSINIDHNSRPPYLIYGPGVALRVEKYGRGCIVGDLNLVSSKIPTLSLGI